MSIVKIDVNKLISEFPAANLKNYFGCDYLMTNGIFNFRKVISKTEKAVFLHNLYHIPCLGQNLVLT